MKSVKKGQCVYIVGIPSPGVSVYCGKPTRYTMVRDDDYNQVRKYDPFCPEHRKVVDAAPVEEDEE